MTATPLDDTHSHDDPVISPDRDHRGMLIAIMLEWLIAIVGIRSHEGQTIGMGRIVGDKALFLHVVDIAVDPEHQGHGLGKVVMATLIEHIEATAPAEVHVSLMADGEAQRLYAQFGFEPVAPRSLGMAVWINKQ